MKVIAELDDREEAARVAGQAPDARGPATALVHQLLDAAAAHRDERDLGRDEDGVEHDEQDDDPELEERVAHQAGASPRRVRPSAARRCAASSSAASAARLADPGRDADGELARRHVAA